MSKIESNPYPWPVRCNTYTNFARRARPCPHIHPPTPTPTPTPTRQHPHPQPHPRLTHYYFNHQPSLLPRNKWIFWICLYIFTYIAAFAMPVCCSGEYWLGLVRLPDSNTFWINGTQYHGSVSNGGTRCGKIKIRTSEVNLNMKDCSSRLMYICEDTGSSGKQSKPFQ